MEEHMDFINRRVNEKNNFIIMVVRQNYVENVGIQITWSSLEITDFFKALGMDF